MTNNIMPNIFVVFCDYVASFYFSYFKFTYIKLLNFNIFLKKFDQ